MIRKFLLCLLFFGLCPFVLGFSLYFSTLSFSNLSAENSGKVLGESNFSSGFGEDSALNPGVVASVIRAEDSTPVIIENYLRYFNSPLLPYKDKILTEAKAYGVKPQLIVAIAQQESNLGKKSPENCFNAWGWAIHENGTLCFTSWNESIETVTAGIAKSYCAKGLCDDPCEMMKKYTPKSNGSWCLAVKQFLNDMETGNF